MAISTILGLQNFRCADFTYDQFVIKEWKAFLGLAIQECGPQRRIRFPTEVYTKTMADIGSQIAGATTTAAPKTGKTTTKTKQVSTLTTTANIEPQLYS